MKFKRLAGLSWGRENALSGMRRGYTGARLGRMICCKAWACEGPAGEGPAGPKDLLFMEFGSLQRSLLSMNQQG